VNSIDDFVTLVRDELGLPVTAQDVGRSLDEIPGWDSVHLLWLATALERATGTQVSLARVLEADCLEQIYQTAAAR
jgi:acyl carrier protein